VGSEDITSDTPTPVKANAGAVVTLTVTIPTSLTVVDFKINKSAAPQKTSAGGVSPATYTFIVSGTSTIYGTLVAETAEALSKIESAFDNTLQSLSIAQGVLALADSGSGNMFSFNRASLFSDLGDSGDSPEDDAVESVFDKSVTDYTTSVPFTGWPAVVSATPSETEADVAIKQESSGSLVINITVTAPFWKLYPDYIKQDGDAEWVDAGNKSKTYTVTVTRGPGSADTGISSITAYETIIEDKNNDIYAGTVSSDVNTLHLNAAASHANAKVQFIFGGITTPPYIANAAESISAELASLTEGANSVTVKVTAENETANKEYTVGIYKEAQGSSKTNNAEGGFVKIQTIDGIDYEIHTFTVDADTPLGSQKTYTLEFKNKPAGGTVEVLAVGGGGAGGGVHSIRLRGGGGGAGGFVYVPDYNIGNVSSFDVKVGAGGAKVAAVDVTVASTGGNGGNSAFGNEIAAYGGGGAGSHCGPTTNNNSSPGGSGGGGTWMNGGAATKGVATGYPGAIILGNRGGNAYKLDYSAAGGGGAGEQGTDNPNTFAHNENAAVGSSGGVGTQSAISGQLLWYAGGGAGTAEEGYNDGPGYGAKLGNDGGANTGNGGSGAGKVDGKVLGGNGGSGIVIVRWPHNSGE
jgi:hypothetical protein